MARKEEKTRKKNESEVLGKYPGLSIVGEEHVDQQIISAIKKAYKNIILTVDSKRKSESELIVCDLLKHIKKHGFHSQQKSNNVVNKFWDIYKPGAGRFLNYVYESIKSKENDKLGFFISAVHSTTTILTNKIFKCCKLESILPDTFMLCSLYKDGLLLRFHQIPSKATPSGRVYKHEKSIVVDGKEYEIWFTKHALERVMQRVASFDVMKIMGEFMSHAHFEFSGFGKFQHLLCAYLATSISGSVAITDEDDIPTMSGQNPVDMISKYLYFPFVVEDNRIICKSGLIPGFYGTPEFLLRQAIEKNNVVFEGEMVDLDKPIKTNGGKMITPSKVVRDFYEKNCDGQMVNTNNFYFISYIFHKLGMVQYYMGEIESFFPIISRNIKE